LNEEDIFYLMSRGLNRKEAENLIVTGFLSPIIKALPLEYAVELNRLIEIEFEASIL
jgi:Fe-S cluster assembly protein SufB